MVDRGVLLLPQHHQSDDDHSRYDDASDHQADDGALVGAHVLREEHLQEGERPVSRQSHCIDQSEVSVFTFTRIIRMLTFA